MGALSQLKTLTANPVTEITPYELMVYEDYRDGYARYWSEYFDPIVVRADVMPDGVFALETFILPLIDNSEYVELKRALRSEIPERTTLPIYDKNPVATLSVSIPAFSEDDRNEFLSEFGFDGYFMPSLNKLISVLGHTAVISIQDSAPIIQASFPGFSEQDDVRSNPLGLGTIEMITIPVFSSLFTRPVDVAIAVTDEEQARKALKRLYFADFNELMTVNKTFDDATNTLY